MQIYALKMHNFMKFGDTGNTIVFDLSDEQKRQLNMGIIKMDDIYVSVLADPCAHVRKTKENGIERFIGIAGMIDGSKDNSNGAGKSTILEAICYCHYDKIIRKLANTNKKGSAGLDIVTKINGVYPVDMESCYVEEIFEENNKVYRIKRGHQFSKTQKSHSPILEFECYNEDIVDSLAGHRVKNTDKEIEEVTINDFDVFVNSQMFGQGDAGKFLTGTDKTRKELLISMLKLEDVVSGCVEMVRTMKNKTIRGNDTIEANVNSLESELMEWIKTNIDASCSEFDNILIPKIDAHIKNKNQEYNDKSASLLNDINDIDKKITNFSNASSLVKLNAFREKRKMIAEQVKEKRRVASQRIDGIKDSLSTERKNIVKEEEKITKISDKIVKLSNEKSELEKFILEFKEEEVKKFLSKSAEINSLKNTLVENRTSTRLLREAKIEDRASLRSDTNRLKTEITNLKHSLSQATDSGFVCSSCKSMVTKEHVNGKIKEMSVDVTGIATKIKNLDEMIDAFDKQIVEFDSKLSKIDDYKNKESDLKVLLNKFNDSKTKINDLKTQIDENNEQIVSFKNELIKFSEKIDKLNEEEKTISLELEKELSIIKIDYDRVNEDILGISEEAEGITKKINFLTDEKNRLVREKAVVEKSMGSLLTEKDQLDKKIKLFQETKKKFVESRKQVQRYMLLEDAFGLDGVQTRIIAKYLPLLNIYIKEYLDILSEGHVGLRVFINDKSEVDLKIEGGMANTFEMCSGGEKGIIRLSINIGLALLSFSRMARQPEMISLDEIFGPLDNFHTETVFRMLEHLKDKFKRILVISHKSEIQKILNRNILICRDGTLNGCSTIKYIGKIEEIAN